MYLVVSFGWKQKLTFGSAETYFFSCNAWRGFVLENLALDIESRSPVLWKERRPEGCFSALHKVISNYTIFVIRRGLFYFFFFSLTFSRVSYM